MNHSSLLLSSDVSSNNRFEVLQNVQEESTQNLEMANAQESTPLQHETNYRQRKPETIPSGNIVLPLIQLLNNLV